MTEKEVRQAIKSAGGRWDYFVRWMRGQTMGVNPDGSTNFYEGDVERFIRGGCSLGTYVPD